MPTVSRALAGTTAHLAHICMGAGELPQQLHASPVGGPCSLPSSCSPSSCPSPSFAAAFLSASLRSRTLQPLSSAFLSHRACSSGGNLATSLWWDHVRKSTRLNSSHSQISYAVFC